MANFLPTAQKICWLSFSSFFSASSASDADGPSQQLEKEPEPPPTHQSQKNGVTQIPNSDPISISEGLRRRFVWPLSFRNSEPKKPCNFYQNEDISPKLMSSDINNSEVKEDPLYIMGVFKSGKNRRSRLPVSSVKSNGSDGNEKGVAAGDYSGCKCVIVENESSSGTIMEECSHLCKRVLSYQDAPLYLRFNPHITGGYRGMLSPKDCVKSLFWWTNETLNIWSHLIGWFFFLGLTVYDALGLLDVPTSHPWDRVVFTLLLICFQACMLLSSLYHIFCCHSEVFYRRWLSADLLGVSLTLLAIYISGIYYAFSCVPFWLNFYLLTVGAIFVTAMVMQILPMVSKKEMVTEERFHWRLIVFGGWAAYGVIPTFHWACLHGGMASEAVALLLPRIIGMYIISGFAFIFYVARIPEKVWPGLVNYIGSSHQIWHVLILVSLYHWHNTGMIYLKFRATHPCSEEYATLFPAEVTMVQYN